MTFYKYHGTGNDFILIDNRNGNIRLNKQQVADYCHRRFGIGADGLMLLELATGYDFRMVYFNADGGESTMCGNGGRCITAFARRLGIIDNVARFIAIDGPHMATIDDEGRVSLAMNDVTAINEYDGYCVLNTGSPHYVKWVADAKGVDVYNEGRAIRTSEPFGAAGINVNFAQVQDSGIFVRTYERGVEDETLSCGTGVTAVAIAAARADTGIFSIAVNTPGGDLRVAFTKVEAHIATEVTLTGLATFVYEGVVGLTG